MEKNGKSGALAMTGGLVAAIAASACCWLPLLLLSLGVSGAAAGAAFERYRPILLTATFLLLGVAFYFAYCKRPIADDCCGTSDAKPARLRSMNHVMLWIVTALAATFAFFPSYVGVIIGGQPVGEVPAGHRTMMFAIDGMTCEACAVTLEKALGQIEGVATVRVDYDHKHAILAIPEGHATVSEAAILERIESAGYHGRSLDREPT